MREDLKAFFFDPKTPKQRQYEALRAYVLEEVTAKDAAICFGFTESTLYSITWTSQNQKLTVCTG